MRIVGCGNRERGDDAVGLLVADRLRELGAKAENYSGDPFGLMHLWSRGDDVLLVDAVVTGAPPGAVYLWDGLHQHMAGSCPTSSHGLDVVQAIELARALDRLPRQLRICGIEAREFSVGAKITKPVQQAGEAVLKAILKEHLEVSPSRPFEDAIDAHASQEVRAGIGIRQPYRIFRRRINLDLSACSGFGR